ncbi:MAG: SDR family NAD(P)-dependent oxidoreductase [Candidatus Dormibacteria bacterium]
MVVCGATGALGRAVVAELGGGAEVVAVDRQLPFPEPVRQAWAGARVHELAGDLSSAAAVDRLWAEIDAIGPASALVNLVGGFAAGSVLAGDQGTYESMLELNLTTAWRSCRAGAARLVAAGGGAIVNVSARTARQGGQGSAAYAVAKAGVMRLTEVLAAELAAQRVRVNAVLPSVIDTAANRQAMSEKTMAQAVPPAAIAGVIAFLVSAAAWPISGAAIPVYGWA